MTHTVTACLFAFLILLIGTVATPSTTFAASSCTNLTASFGRGASDTSTNASVSQLQNFLRAQGFFSAETSGHFGPVTLAAVKRFQTANRLEAVGIVGPLTRALIRKISCVPTPIPTPTTPSISSGHTSTTSSPQANQQAAVITAVSQAPTKDTQTSLPYLTQIFEGWKGTWGTVSTTSDGTLLVQANASTTGAEAIYPASINWTNYRYSADMSTSNGDITLIGRYRDEDNFISCTFVADHITMNERIKGVTKTVAVADVPDISRVPAPRRTWVTLRVSGPTIGCSESGPTDNVTYTTSDSSELTGGIGAQTYFSIPNDTTLGVYEVRVDAI